MGHAAVVVFDIRCAETRIEAVGRLVTPRIDPRMRRMVV